MITPAAHVFYIGDEDLPAAAIDLAALYEVPLADVSNYAALYFKDGAPYIRIGSASAVPLVPRWTATLPYSGEAVLNQVFDGYTLASAAVLTQIELSVQDAPTGSGGVTIQLVDGGGASIGAPITVTTGTKYSSSILGASLAIAANTLIRGKITGIGGTFAGAGLTIRLSFHS